MPEDQRVQIPHVPPGQQKGQQQPAGGSKILPQNYGAERQHDCLAHGVQPHLLGDKLPQTEMRHQPAANAEQRHMEQVDADKRRPDGLEAEAELLHKMPQHHQQDAQAFHNINIIAACGFVVWHRTSLR